MIFTLVDMNEASTNRLHKIMKTMLKRLIILCVLSLIASSCQSKSKEKEQLFNIVENILSEYDTRFHSSLDEQDVFTQDSTYIISPRNGLIFISITIGGKNTSWNTNYDELYKELHKEASTRYNGDKRVKNVSINEHLWVCIECY